MVSSHSYLSSHFSNLYISMSVSSTQLLKLCSWFWVFLSFVCPHSLLCYIFHYITFVTRVLLHVIDSYLFFHRIRQLYFVFSSFKTFAFVRLPLQLILITHAQIKSKPCRMNNFCYIAAASIFVSVCLSVCTPLFLDTTVGSQPNLARICGRSGSYSLT